MLKEQLLQDIRKSLNYDTLQSLTEKLQGRITTQGDPCSHYMEWVCREDMQVLDYFKLVCFYCKT